MTLTVHSTASRLGGFVLLGRFGTDWSAPNSLRVYDTYDEAEEALKNTTFEEVVVAQVSAEFLRSFQFVQKKAYP